MGRVNRNCSTCKMPFAGGSLGAACGDVNSDQAGADPILLSTRAAVTDPFTDFGIDRVSKLSITRSYNSADYDLTVNGAGGLFGNAWHHDWEAYLTCSDDICTVMRGTVPGFQFSYSSSQTSLDGTETWDVYLPHAVYPFTAAHHAVLARRPSGEWIVFTADGRESHFATVCTSCDSSTGVYCKTPENGGRARLVKVVDPVGNGVTVGYDPAQRVLLRLSDDLGHALELRSGSSCPSPAYATELRYDGATVARYTIQNNQLAGVNDAAGTPMRSYLYTGIGLRWPRLTAVENQAGNPIAEFSYDAQGYAIGVVDANSSVSVSYSADGWSSTILEYFRGPDGDTSSSSTRALDYSGQVTSISGAASSGSPKNIVWTPASRVGCSIDAEGRVEYQDHDADGRVVYRLEFTGDACEVPSVLPADAREEWREYGVTRTVAQGVTISLDVPTRVWRRSALAGDGFAAEESDYDQSPSAIDPAGYSCAAAALPAGSVVCRQISGGYVTAGAGTRLARYATFFSYDGKGRLVRTYGPVDLDQSGPNDVVPLEERTYWADGEASARQGRLHEVKRYASPTAQPLVTSYDYDMFGVAQIVAPDGTGTSIAKDARGRATVVSQADGSGAVRASSETRYHDGSSPRVRVLAAGSAERYGYDARGRVVQVERLSGDPEAPGANPVLGWVERYTYDQAGNRIHSERADAAGNVVWRQDRAYDVQHHVVWESNPGLPATGRTWAYDSSGFMRQTLDEEGRGTTFTPDGLGRVKGVRRTGQDALGAPASLDVATYLYGATSDTVTAVLDADGRATGYSYDDFGRVEQVTAATIATGGGRWFRYDARGNVVQRGDSTVQVSYAYDGLDRLLLMSATNAADGSAVAYQYVYDEGTNPGRLTSVLEPERTVTFSYDWAGRLAAEVVTEAGIPAPLATQYAYDEDGAITQVTYPSGLIVSYERDAATREVTLVRNAVTGSPFASQIARVPGGPISSMTFGNGLTLSQAFSLRYEPFSVASGPLALSYVPSPSGDVGTATDESVDTDCVRGSTRTFGYDLLDRLVSWGDVVAEGAGRCAAGPVGDLASELDYAEGTDRLAGQWKPDRSGHLAYAFGYDLEGNVSAIGQLDATGSAVTTAVCLRHDALGRLAQVGYTSTALAPGTTACLLDSDVSSTLARYRYDSQNRRVARQVNGEWTYFVMDSSGSPLSELAPTGDPANPWHRVRDYVWLDGRALGQIEYDGGSSQTYYVHTDHLGTPRALTNASGALVWSALQRPYGEVGEKTVADPVTGRTVVTNLRLPGQYDERLLGGLGLQGPYYNWNRWYLPGVGRYLEPDPRALRGRFNTRYGVDWYGYADQNPLSKFDPRGTVPCTLGDTTLQCCLKKYNGCLECCGATPGDLPPANEPMTPPPANEPMPPPNNGPPPPRPSPSPAPQPTPTPDCDPKRKDNCDKEYAEAAGRCADWYTSADDTQYDACMERAWKNYMRCLNGLPWKQNP